MLLTTSKYIIIVCDDEELCRQLDQSLKEQPPVARTAIVNTLEQLHELIAQELPDTILLYLVQPECAPAQWIRKIRNEKAMDNIPLLSYSGEPDAPDLRELLS
ncbi:response regulator [Filimonas effusa]|uniref:Response regulator n=1 Tax=Filimonas effusa TaxID=2508721 RepID=A0A4Q1DAE4_9BACT|nr:response regulator [Filimonas effusa]RXK86361.1 response regulator [Filimonas effusa]